jgi:hypothetical protein
MNLEYINNHSVIDRYILNQLSEQEQVEFELYFMEHPEVLDEVEMARSLKRGLTEHQEALGEPATAAPGEDKPSLLQVLGGWFQLPTVLAGNFAVIAVLLVLVLLPGEEPPPSAFSADRAWIGQVRGDDPTLNIELNSGSLVLDIDVDGAGPFRVSLLDARGEQVRNIEQVPAFADALLVVLKTDDMLSGGYTLRVTDPQGDTVIQRKLLLIVSH